jgi:hypothetical protein
MRAIFFEKPIRPSHAMRVGESRSSRPRGAAALRFAAVGAALLLSVGGLPGAAKTRPAPATQSAEAGAQWLRRISARAQEVEALRAKVVYDRIQGLVQDRQRRFGTLWYRKGSPMRLAVHFDRVLVDETVREQARRYVFDGTWFVERLPRRKRLIKHRVAAEEKGLPWEKRPLPLPLELDAEKLLKRYRVQLVERRAPDSDGPVRVHLRLTPRDEPKREALERVSLWYRAGAALPHKIATTDASENRSVLRLRDVTTEPSLPDEVFDTTPPADEDWDVEIRGAAEGRS